MNTSTLWRQVDKTSGYLVRYYLDQQTLTGKISHEKLNDYEHPSIHNNTDCCWKIHKSNPTITPSIHCYIAHGIQILLHCFYCHLSGIEDQNHLTLGKPQLQGHGLQTWPILTVVIPLLTCIFVIIRVSNLVEVPFLWVVWLLCNFNMAQRTMILWLYVERRYGLVYHHTPLSFNHEMTLQYHCSHI